MLLRYIIKRLWILYGPLTSFQEVPYLLCVEARLWDLLFLKQTVGNPISAAALEVLPDITY